MGLVAIAGWIVTVVLAYVLVGGYYGQVFEGVNRTYLSTLPFWITGAAAAVSLVCTAFWVWRSRAADGSPFRTTRRRFILGTVGAAGGLATSVAAALGRNERWDSVTRRYIFRVKPEYKSEDYQTIWAGSRIAEYRRLGRTEALESDISLGSGSSTGGRL